jgi:CDP-glucose 4,6-dehydratase
MLAEALYKKGADYVGAWNFGCNSIDAKSVQDILKQLCESNLNVNWGYEKSDVHEATLLKLDSSKARANLGWRPRWSIDTALNKAIEWYMASYEKRNMVEITDAQINCYENT